MFAVFSELFSSDIGLLSIFTIGFVIVIAIFFLLFFGKKINEDSRRRNR
ncbi:MAG: DUF3149 domain-containing protein [Zoogloeaceae bacterium]|nr:DUF3149 domain-containing protein [Zoogloeaceae bacterium]